MSQYIWYYSVFHNQTSISCQGTMTIRRLENGDLAFCTFSLQWRDPLLDYNKWPNLDGVCRGIFLYFLPSPFECIVQWTGETKSGQSKQILAWSRRIQEQGEEDRQRQREFQQQQVQTYLSANILEISRMGSHEISETLVSKRTTRKAEREQIEIRISKTKKKRRMRDSTKQPASQSGEEHCRNH